MTIMLLFKVTVLLLATLVAAALLRRAPASARHRFWTGVFAALLAFPVLASIGPTVHIPLPERVAAWRDAPMVAPAARPVVETAVDSPSTGAASNAEGVITLDAPIGKAPRPSLASRLSAGRLLVAIWLIGAAAAAAALIVSLLRVRWLARSADLEVDHTWRHAADALAARLGLRRAPRLLSSPAVTTPMAAGVFHPTIFLPIAGRTWTAEQRDVVLAHEIAHLVAHDPLRHVMARLAMACYWFHPVAWLVAREADRAREHACDEAVLSLGTKPSAYARVLLDLAESLAGAPPLRGALPMVEPSMLEKRLMTILNSDRPSAPRQVLVLPALGVAFLTFTVAAAQPAVAPAPPAQASGVVTVNQAEAPPTQSSVLEILAGKRQASGATPSFAQGVAGDMVCDTLAQRRRSFSGNITMDNSGSGRVIYEQVGSSGSDRVVQKSFGDLRVCMVAEGLGEWAFNESDRPSRWLDRASRVVLETSRGGRLNQLEIVATGSDRRTTWRVGGAARPLDQAAQQWRGQLLAVLDTTWELSMLRGQVSSLRGDISSIEGERSSLRGEISSLRGEVSSMRGDVSSVRGEESSLRGEISSIRGHVSSLRGAISSERGAISSLTGSRYWMDRADRDRVERLIDSHEKEIDRLEQEIRDFNEAARVAEVEKRLAALNADQKVAAIEAQIKAFDVESRVAEVERQIAKLGVEGQVSDIERKIADLDADRRARQLEDRRNAELRRLEAAMSAIK